MKCKHCWGTGRELNQVHLGREARNRRLARGVGLIQGATRLKISPSMLCLLEEGKRRWSQSLWQMMKKVFGS